MTGDHEESQIYNNSYIVVGISADDLITVLS